MKTVPECDLNWFQDCDGLGILAKDRQAEIQRDMEAVFRQHSPLVARILRFSWRRVLAIAVANVMVNWGG